MQRSVFGSKKTLIQQNISAPLLVRLGGGCGAAPEALVGSHVEVRTIRVGLVLLISF